jgi:tryptophanyl-tRNA synthetase
MVGVGRDTLFMMNEIAVSGIKPTGLPHLGHYLGMLRQVVELQKTHTEFVFIPDLHALTVERDPKNLHSQTIEAGRTILALGLNPKTATVFAQSQVTGHTELTWIFNCLTSVGQLERMTQYKDRARVRGEKVNFGLMDYPVLMAADILLYKGAVVPVGEDQVQHVELARDIARAFNRAYGETFPETKPRLTSTPRVMSLTDPTKKMSKTGDEAVLLTDSPEEMQRKFKGAVTAASGGGDSPGVANLFLILEAFADFETVRKFRGAEGDGSIRYSEFKTELAQIVANHFADFRSRHAKITDDEVIAVLTEGAKKAQVVADRTMAEVRKKVGLLPLD